MRVWVDFLLLTEIFSVWIFLFKKIYVSDNLECKCAAQIGAVRLTAGWCRLQRGEERREERGDGQEAPLLGHTRNATTSFSPTPNRKNTGNLDSAQLTFYAHFTHTRMKSSRAHNNY